MIQVTTDVSDALECLLRTDAASVDGVEVGPWYRPEQVSAYRQKLNPLPFTFHGADLIHSVGWQPGAIGKIKTYLTCSASPWVSLHLSAWLPRWQRTWLTRGWPLPAPGAERVASRLAWQIRRLKKMVKEPVLLENVEPQPWKGYSFYSKPAWISRILEQTGCALLLDTGHARVAAAASGMEPAEYLNRLPLDRVMQIHASGPRLRNGRLFDAHEPLEEVDYDLLQYLLGRSRPQMVTLEYTREPTELRQQLLRLRKMMKYG